MEKSRDEKAEEIGDPEENPPTSEIATGTIPACENPGVDPPRDRARFALVGDMQTIRVSLCHSSNVSCDNRGPRPCLLRKHVTPQRMGERSVQSVANVTCNICVFSMWLFFIYILKLRREECNAPWWHERDCNNTLRKTVAETPSTGQYTGPKYQRTLPILANVTLGAAFFVIGAADLVFMEMDLICTVQDHDGNTARLARRNDKALGAVEAKCSQIGRRGESRRHNCDIVVPTREAPYWCLKKARGRTGARGWEKGNKELTAFSWILARLSFMNRRLIFTSSPRSYSANEEKVLLLTSNTNTSYMNHNVLREPGFIFKKICSYMSLKAIRAKVGTFEINLRKSHCPVPAYIFTRSLSDNRPVKLTHASSAGVIYLRIRVFAKDDVNHLHKLWGGGGERGLHLHYGMRGAIKVSEADSWRRLTTAGHAHLHVYLVRCPDDKERCSQCHVGLYRARSLIFPAPFTGRRFDGVNRQAVQLRPDHFIAIRSLEQRVPYSPEESILFVVSYCIVYPPKAITLLITLCAHFALREYVYVDVLGRLDVFSYVLGTASLDHMGFYGTRDRSILTKAVD
ncbi:hypothetical protein PR048_028091 [Dryococelus australis]|uniref:Uncharacterized protein n=1 Tax=Dryococelus australis TaxID=614101 RepID=A0ABQ9GIA1_9NEOP|nr:hypothetical protein PR048_028091 [Dryococelus australis]